MARQVFFAIALFLSSAGGLVIEIVAGRLIAPYVGMSPYTWTAIIAVVLAGLSAGHWIGGRLAGRAVDAETGAIRLAAALAFASDFRFRSRFVRPGAAAAAKGSDDPVTGCVAPIPPRLMAMWWACCSGCPGTKPKIKIRFS